MTGSTLGSGMLISLLGTSDKIAQTFIFKGYAHLVVTYKPTIYALAGLSITALGYAVVNGWVSLSLSVLSKRILLMGCFLGLALHGDFFAQTIYTLLVKAPNALALQIVQSVPGSHFGSCDSIQHALQQTFYEGIGFGQSAWERGGLNNPLPWVWAILLWAMTYGFTGLILLELITAQFGLAILLVLSPLMLPMGIFPATKSLLFDPWVRHLVGFAWVPIFMMSASSLCLLLMHQSSSTLQTAISNHQLTLTPLVSYVLCGLVSIGLIKKAAYLAASAGGGFSISVGEGISRLAKTWGLMGARVSVGAAKSVSVPVKSALSSSETFHREQS